MRRSEAVDGDASDFRVFTYPMKDKQKDGIHIERRKRGGRRLSDGCVCSRARECVRFSLEKGGDRGLSVSH